MEFPMELKIAVENMMAGNQQEQLKKTAQNISTRYRNESGTGKKLVTTDLEALVYSLVRMPATFGAVSEAVQQACASAQTEIRTVMDVGAGTGAASWAVDAVLSPEEFTCVEREPAMRRMGQTLMEEGSEALRNAQWVTADLTAGELPRHADLVVSSYVLNEMSDAGREKVAQKLWEAADRMLLIIEPGTPVGFAGLQSIREQLLRQGAHLAAPCPHEGKCRLSGDDWCHFAVRVQRSKAHKLLKDGDVPYEDEKYCYMAFVKEPAPVHPARILRHPYVEKGQIALELCTPEENCRTVLKKKDGERFKKAKKAKWGDSFPRE